jgi:hypothetical protein
MSGENLSFIWLKVHVRNTGNNVRFRYKDGRFYYSGQQLFPGTIAYFAFQLSAFKDKKLSSKPGLEAFNVIFPFFPVDVTIPGANYFQPFFCSFR